LRYWGRLGRLALESVTALVPLVTERPAAELAAAAPPAAAPRTLLVEAEAGQTGVGMFMVENTTGQQLSIPVTVSAFHDPEGREVAVAIGFRPELVVLDPGDQAIVQVAAAPDESLEPNERYHAQISVPGLAASRIPIVVRRRASATPQPRRPAKAKTRAS
jgi:hypothetical protein